MKKINIVKLIEALEDHYWNSLYREKDLIMIHIKSVIEMIKNDKIL